MVIQKSVRRKQVANPLIAGIDIFLSRHSLCDAESDHVHATNVSGINDLRLPQPCQNQSCRFTLEPTDLPKRYTLYEPMLLLGASFPSQTPAWEAFYCSLTSIQCQGLHQSIADAFCKSGHLVTHIALNAPIQASLEHEESQQHDNILRSPVDLQPLLGDFGPAMYSADSPLTRLDMDNAFWVETSQVQGIKQVWAPRWTMFSRGNIREKNRILAHQGVFPGLTEAELGEDVNSIDVVDFYIGIGYFAFSYLKRGVRTVFGWDLNQWSIEGLRRGCEKNGWPCLVVTLDNGADDQTFAIEQVIEGLLSSTPPRCVAFCGDNRLAANIMASIAARVKDGTHTLNVRHANLGLLPTSQGAWEGAVRVLNDNVGGWLHVHENTQISSVRDKEQEVLNGLRKFSAKKPGPPWEVAGENIEMVKTYAPGVGHYVFDIKLWPAR